MKIDTTRPQPPTATPNTEGVAKGNKGDRANGDGCVEDSVGLSEIGLLATKIDNISEERIQELRRQVQSGAYQVDAQKISERLVQSMLEK